MTTNKLTSYVAHLLLLLALITSAAAHSAERITFYHNDNLGSPVAATDTQGNVVWRESYQPDGTRLQHQGDNQNKLWFTGKQEESTFGVSYFGARWYDPEMGRFLAMDPVGVSASNPNSFNRYAYANNNPYRFVDPDGRESLVEAQANLAQGMVRRRDVDGVQKWVTVCPGYIDYDDPGIYWRLFTSLAMPFSGELSAARDAAIVDTGASSVVNGLRLNMQLSAEQAAGVRMPTQITGYSNHALEQIAGRDGGIGVNQSALIEAWSNPMKIDYVPTKYGPSFRLTGKDAAVAVNVDGKVITTWAKSAAGTAK